MVTLLSAQPEHHHYLALGAGPAGLQAGYCLAQDDRDYLILEAGRAPGTFFRTYPRHRTLLSINKVHTGYADPEVNLRWDWNSLLTSEGAYPFSAYSREYFPPADAFCDYLAGYATEHKLAIRYDCRVRHVTKRDGLFLLTAADGSTLSCRVLIVATGTSLPHVPNIDGIEHAELYCNISTDPEEYAGQRVLIIGKGNSAFETAESMMATAALIHLASRHPVRQAWKTHFPGDLRAINNGLLETYQLKQQNALLDATIERITKTASDGYVASFRYEHADGECEDLRYDRVICCAGFRFDASIFDESCRPTLIIDGRFPDIGSDWQSVNVPGLYFAGGLTQVRDLKKAASAFMHGYRYNARTLIRILAGREHGVAWPHQSAAATPDDLSGLVIERINRTSALWQQFGYLCDLIVVDERPGTVRHYEELPVDYIGECGLGPGEHYYTLTLEYGHQDDHADPFNYSRIARDDVDRARESRFLHPILRRYRGQRLLSEHHIIEDLAAEWRGREHIDPLREFLAGQLASPAASGMSS